MHFLLLAALAVLASPFQRVAALSIQLTERETPAVLSLPVEYHPVSQAKLRNRDPSSTIQADTILYEAIPMINVTVGTPPQAIKVAIDIQDVFTTLIADDLSGATKQRCSDDDFCTLMGYFDPEKSSTFKSIQPPAGSPPRPVNADVVTVGGQRVDGLPMFLNDINSGAYSSIALAPRLSLSFPFLLVDQGIINSPSFSLWSDPSLNNQGHLLFGGVNEAMYEGPLQAFPFPGSTSDVSLPIAAVVVASSGNSTAGPATSRHNITDSPAALLSTVGNFTFLPNETVQQIYADLSITPVFEFNASIGFVDCARLHSENRTISLVFGNVTISVPWSKLFLPSGNNTCEFTIVPYSPDLSAGALGSQIQIGAAFLQHMYLAVDYDDMFAAVAPLNPNPGPDHILEIGNGTRIPDADGQFPATITPYVASSTSTMGILPTTSTESSAWAVAFKPRAMDITLAVTGTIFAVFYLMI